MTVQADNAWKLLLLSPCRSCAQLIPGQLYCLTQAEKSGLVASLTYLTAPSRHESTNSHCPRLRDLENSDLQQRQGMLPCQLLGALSSLGHHCDAMPVADQRFRRLPESGGVSLNKIGAAIDGQHRLHSVLHSTNDRVKDMEPLTEADCGFS